MRATSLAAGGLACAGAAMTIAAFAGGGHAAPAPTPAPTTAPARATADRGAQVFAEQGCGSCHTFAPANARGGLGPDLALSLHGKSRDLVLRSIVAPDADVAYGWSPGMMPADFAKRIAPNDLVPLTEYLMRGAAG